MEDGSWMMEAGSWKFFEQLNSPEVYPKPVEGFPFFFFFVA